VEILVTVQSPRQARRIQNELAVQGGWVVSGVDEYAVIYARSNDGVVEELRVEKEKIRQWRVVKEVRQGRIK